MKHKKRGILFLALAVILLVLPLVSAQTTGCYVYPDENVYCTQVTQDVAQNDCAQQQSCDLSKHFLAGKQCSSLDQCRKVTCSTDCLTHTKGYCEEVLKGKELSLLQQNEWCAPGCCVIGNSCDYPVSRTKCSEVAQQTYGLQSYSSFINAPDMDRTKCLAQSACQATTGTESISGTVRDEQQQPLAGVTVNVQGTAQQATTDAQGTYTLTGIAQGQDVVITANKQNYLSATLSITVKKGTNTLDFTLTDASKKVVVKGTVTDSQNKPLDQTTISLKGPTQTRVFTDTKGAYSIEAAPGTYTFIVSKIGFVTQQIAVTLPLTKPTLDFILATTTFYGIEGKVYSDSNRNGVIDNSDKPVAGARILVDGVFRGYSQFPDGTYKIPLNPTKATNYVVRTLHEGQQSKDISVSLDPKKTATQDLLLELITGPCSEKGTEQKVAVFSAAPIPGQKEILLQWSESCADVLAYGLYRVEGSNKVFLKQVPRSVRSYTDANVEWEKTYTYEIIALYDQSRKTEPTVSQEVSPGQQACEGKFAQGTWDTFCRLDDTTTTQDERQVVWTCSNENKLISAGSCAGTDFCAPSSARVAQCKSAAACTLLGAPFGLGATSELCYGTSTPEKGTANFCTYDKLDSTIVNVCKLCTQVSSCFSYNSKEACEVNSCLTQECAWVDGASNTNNIAYTTTLPANVQQQTGAGYCAPKEYKQVDQCASCSEKSSLFENYYCTADVCSALGSCFSEQDLRSCESCGEQPSSVANCYTYQTEQECSAGQPVTAKEGNIVYSQDQCGWQVCRWTGAANGHGGSCVKDANADTQDDCAQFTNAGEQAACRLDITAPHTTFKTIGAPTITLTNTNLTFVGDDSTHKHATQNNPLQSLSYCLTPASSAQPCTQFISVAYPGRTTKEEVTVNILAHPILQKKNINGEGYKLYFSSTDKYNNQENRQEGIVYVDNVAPDFTINHTVETIADVSTYDFLLEGLSERSSCDLTFTPLFPQGQASVVKKGVEDTKQATFAQQKGALFSLNVTCIDERGNVKEVIQRYTADIDQTITVLTPPQVIGKTAFPIRVQTSVGANCQLYLTDTNQKLADFRVTNTQGTLHETQELTGFNERDYVGVYKVACTDLLTQELYEELLDFTVDLTSPSVEVVLEEGSRRTSARGTNWETFFIKEAKVYMQCRPGSGFACKDLFYCTGENCGLAGVNYQQYDASLTFNETTRFCYYATDEGNTSVRAPACGDIVIDGFGITLKNPEPYTFEADTWSVSNKPSFEWRFFTRVPTTACHFDVVPDFRFSTVEKYKIAQKQANGDYVVRPFPEEAFLTYPQRGGVQTLYVKCTTADGEVGPQKKIVLEFDPHKPTITDTDADPNPVINGVSTTLQVTTDRRAVCKFSDNTEGKGSQDYATMEYSFTSQEEGVLATEHTQEFAVNFLGAKKEFGLYVQCQTGAGLLSDVATLNFSVDYTVAGNIMSIAPQGIVGTNDVDIVVTTNRNAACFLWNNGTQEPFLGAGGVQHTKRMFSLEEKEHVFRLRCNVAGRNIEREARFSVDLEAPQITQVDDGQYSCGTSSFPVLVYTDEKNITLYDYEIFEYSATNGSSSLAKGTLAAATPLKIPAENLTLGNSYVVAVRAQDAAGHWSTFERSDGVQITYANETACQNATNSQIIVQTNATCTGVSAELHCGSAVGCQDITYGQATSSSSCSPSVAYTGAKISYDATGWLCYKASGREGSNMTASKIVTFLDADGDKISDSCDVCPDTKPGVAVDSTGCAQGEVTASQQEEDTDNDRLPDAWEKQYNDAACALDFTQADSDGDGQADTTQDYDQDGLTNYDEYVSNLNPCLSDAPEQEEEPTPTTQEPTTAAPPQEGNVVALVFFILGLLMEVGGIGYLVYYYKVLEPQQKTSRPSPQFSPQQPKQQRQAQPYYTPVTRESAPQQAAPTMSWEEFKQKRTKQKQRKSLFSSFDKYTKDIPHVDRLLKKKAPHQKKVVELAQAYVEDKKDMQPGLRQEEKGLFKKLEKIAKKTQTTDPNKVVSKEEAKDIFAKLKEMSQKRKEE